MRYVASDRCNRLSQKWAAASPLWSATCALALAGARAGMSASRWPLLAVSGLLPSRGPRAVRDASTPLAHDPEKWIPVFGKRSCATNMLERDDDSKKSRSALVYQDLIDQRVDHLPILPARRSRRLRHPHRRQLLARIDPPIGAAGAGPAEIADRAHHARHAGRGAHRQPEPEAVVGAGRIGVADQVADVGCELIGQHVFDGLAAQNAGVAEPAMVHQHQRKAQIVARGRDRAAAAALEL